MQAGGPRPIESRSSLFFLTWSEGSIQQEKSFDSFLKQRLRWERSRPLTKTTQAGLLLHFNHSFRFVKAPRRLGKRESTKKRLLLPHPDRACCPNTSMFKDCGIPLMYLSTLAVGFRAASKAWGNRDARELSPNHTSFHNNICFPLPSSHPIPSSRTSLPMMQLRQRLEGLERIP